MDGLYWKALLKWMIWGYHYFRKHPYRFIERSNRWFLGLQKFQKFDIFQWGILGGEHFPSNLSVEGGRRIPLAHSHRIPNGTNLVYFNHALNLLEKIQAFIHKVGLKTIYK